MEEKFLQTCQKRIAEFLKTDSDDLVYRDYIPLDVEVTESDTQIPFDERLDREYHKVHEKERWGQDWWFGWFHFTAEVPERFAGRELCLRIHTGSEMLVVDKEGIPVYGLTGYSCFDELYCKERMVIGSDFKAGDKIDYWMEAVGHGLFGNALPRPHDLDTPITSPYGHGTRLLKHMRLCVFDREMWHMLKDMRVLYGVLTSYGLNDYRGKRLLKILMEAMNIFNCDCRNASKVRAMLAEKAYSGSGSSALPLAWSIGHGHLDIGWLWPVSSAVGKAARTFSSQVVMLEKYPEYVFGASQAMLYKMVKDNYPELFEKIRRCVAGGRWEVQGGMFVEADCNLASGESLVRQFLHGKNFFKDEFGVEVDNMWLPDVFGYSGNLPQIIRKSGCNYFLTQKLSWNSFNTFPHNTFRWIGVDGSEVISHFPPENNYNAFGIPEQRIPAMNRFAEAGVDDAFICLYGIGDGGGGPSEDFMENNLRQVDLEGTPRVVFGRADDFFHRLDAIAHKLPQWRGELYLEFHRGTLTSQARTKRGNRKCEQALTALEFLYSALPWTDYPVQEMDDMWKDVLLNQFHDILPGSSIHKVYEVAEADYKRILSQASELAAEAAGKLFEVSENEAVLVNTLSVPYSGCVELPANWNGCGIKGIASQNENGRVIADVSLAADSFTTVVRDDTPAPAAGGNCGLVMENALIRYTFASNGQLTGAYDKEQQREVLTGKGNVLSFYNDRPPAHEAWDIEMYYPDEFAGFWEGELESSFTGPVRSVLNFVYRNENSVMRQQVILKNNSKRLDFVTSADWHEHRRMLRTAFPVDAFCEDASYDIQYAYLKRTTTDNTSYDRAKFECCGQRYADLSDADGGAALLNDCKYGYKIKGNVIDMALLRSPKYPDAKADMGEHLFTYSFLPHAGILCESDVMAQAAMLNREPYFFDGFASDKAAPLCRQISGRNISLEVVKKAEKENAAVIRVVETAGRRSSGELCWRDTGLKVVETNLIEWEKGEEVVLDGQIQKISLAPFEIKTFLVQ